MKCKSCFQDLKIKVIQNNLISFLKELIAKFYRAQMVCVDGVCLGTQQPIQQYLMARDCISCGQGKLRLEYSNEDLNSDLKKMKRIFTFQ